MSFPGCRAGDVLITSVRSRQEKLLLSLAAVAVAVLAEVGSFFPWL